jgi:hypothetical protein
MYHSPLEAGGIFEIFAYLTGNGGRYMATGTGRLNSARSSGLYTNWVGSGNTLGPEFWVGYPGTYNPTEPDIGRNLREI